MAYGPHADTGMLPSTLPAARSTNVDELSAATGSRWEGPYGEPKHFDMTLYGVDTQPQIESIFYNFNETLAHLPGPKIEPATLKGNTISIGAQAAGRIVELDQLQPLAVTFSGTKIVGDLLSGNLKTYKGALAERNDGLLQTDANWLADDAARRFGGNAPEAEVNGVGARLTFENATNANSYADVLRRAFKQAGPKDGPVTVEDNQVTVRSPALLPISQDKLSNLFNMVAQMPTTASSGRPAAAPFKP